MGFVNVYRVYICDSIFNESIDFYIKIYLEKTRFLCHTKCMLKLKHPNFTFIHNATQNYSVILSLLTFVLYFLFWYFGFPLFVQLVWFLPFIFSNSSSNFDAVCCSQILHHHKLKVLRKTIKIRSNIWYGVN